MNINIFLLYVFAVFVIEANASNSVNANECISKEKCGECMSTNPECHWCADAGFIKQRCNSARNLTSDNCKEIYGLQNQIEMVRSLHLRYPNDGNDPNPVQMNPKNVTLRMRANSVGNFILDVHQVVNRNSSIQIQIVDDLKNESNIRISYESSCLSDKVNKTDRCESVAFRQTVHFTVTIETTSCPVDVKKRNQTFRIKPAGFERELFVNVEFMCECDCEKPPNKEVNSTKCSQSGTFECGVCSFNRNKFGKQCECDLNAQIGTNDCIKANDENVCSNRGLCICGQCHCLQRSSPQERIYGKYCECDNFSCERFNGQICSGSDHGECECGICKCIGHRSGKACECDTNVLPCIRGNDTNVCSNRGDCVCGKCLCSQRNSQQEVIYGKYCECDNFSCNRFNGHICSGTDHGRCECGICQCNSNWKGNDCSIPV